MKTIKVVAAVICDSYERKTKIFATARGYGELKGQWEFPGGKIEDHETPKEALKREIREELDVEIEVYDKIRTIEYDYPQFHLSMDCFWCEIVSGELKLKEAEAARWLNKDELDSVKWLPADVTIVDKVMEEIGKCPYLPRNKENEIMVEKIYLDMDGVVAWFEKGVRDICHMEAPPQDPNKSCELEDQMWERIKNAGHFYDRLEPMPGAVEMFQKLYEKYGDKCEILTGVPKPKRGVVTAAEDKTKWAHRLLSKDLKVNIVFREEKKNFCKGRDCYLIDDLDKNIKEWEDNGGTGILHKSADETMEILKKLGIL